MCFLRDQHLPPLQKHRIFEWNISPEQQDEACIDRKCSDGYKQGFDIPLGDGDFFISYPSHVVHGSTGPDYETLNPPTLAEDAKRICSILYLHYK